MADIRKSSEIKKYFQKKLLEINRVDALDAAIDLDVDLEREKILVHIYEMSSLVKKEHFFELRGVETIGSSSVKSNHYLLDSGIDEIHFSLEFKGGFMSIKCLSEKGIMVLKQGLIGTKKHPLTSNETKTIKNNDMVALSSTTLIFELFSSKSGILNKDK